MKISKKYLIILGAIGLVAIVVLALTLNNGKFFSGSIMNGNFSQQQDDWDTVISSITDDTENPPIKILSNVVDENDKSNLYNLYVAKKDAEKIVSSSEGGVEVDISKLSPAADGVEPLYLYFDKLDFTAFNLNKAFAQDSTPTIMVKLDRVADDKRFMATSLQGLDKYPNGAYNLIFYYPAQQDPSKTGNTFTRFNLKIVNSQATEMPGVFAKITLGTAQAERTVTAGDQDTLIMPVTIENRTTGNILLESLEYQAYININDMQSQGSLVFLPVTDLSNFPISDYKLAFYGPGAPKESNATISEDGIVRFGDLFWYLPQGGVPLELSAVEFKPNQLDTDIKIKFVPIKATYNSGSLAEIISGDPAPVLTMAFNLVNKYSILFGNTTSNYRLYTTDANKDAMSIEGELVNVNKAKLENNIFSFTLKPTSDPSPVTLFDVDENHKIELTPNDQGLIDFDTTSYTNGTYLITIGYQGKDVASFNLIISGDQTKEEVKDDTKVEEPKQEEATSDDQDQNCPNIDFTFNPGFLTYKEGGETNKSTKLTMVTKTEDNVVYDMGLDFDICQSSLIEAGFQPVPGIIVKLYNSSDDLLASELVDLTTVETKSINALDGFLKLEVVDATNTVVDNLNNDDGSKKYIRFSNNFEINQIKESKLETGQTYKVEIWSIDPESSMTGNLSDIKESKNFAHYNFTITAKEKTAVLDNSQSADSPIVIEKIVEKQVPVYISAPTPTKETAVTKATTEETVETKVATKPRVSPYCTDGDKTYKNAAKGGQYCFDLLALGDLIQSDLPGKTRVPKYQAALLAMRLAGSAKTFDEGEGKLTEKQIVSKYLNKFSDYDQFSGNDIAILKDITLVVKNGILEGEVQSGKVGKILNPMKLVSNAELYTILMRSEGETSFDYIRDWAERAGRYAVEKNFIEQSRLADGEYLKQISIREQVVHGLANLSK